MGNTVVKLSVGEPDAEKRIQAAGIYVRHFYERLPWADCWFQVFPGVDILRDSARRNAMRLVAWLRRTYPIDIDNQMEAHGLGTDDMLEKLRAQGKATTRVKVGEVKRNVYDEHGNLVETVTELQFAHDADWRARDSALGKQMAMHGHGAGASRKPLSEERSTLECERQLLEAPEDLPKTIEEALERGEPITIVEHPDDLSPDEWEREWEAYKAERDREERERGPL